MLHGPYYYRFWREQGRLRKAYVRTKDVAHVRAACTHWRRAHAQERAERKQAHTELRALLSELRRLGW
jgi:hypothetical protein